MNGYGRTADSPNPYKNRALKTMATRVKKKDTEWYLEIKNPLLTFTSVTLNMSRKSRYNKLQIKKCSQVLTDSLCFCAPTLFKQLLCNEHHHFGRTNLVTSTPQFCRYSQVTCMFTKMSSDCFFQTVFLIF